MKNIELFFIFLILFNSSFSLLCVDSIFDPIFINKPRNFKVQPKKEVCFKYKLTKLKNKISLNFALAQSYTAEVVIYKSLYGMEIKDGSYINSEEKYLIVKNSFKEIDVSNFYDYVYIIIRDTKNYFFYDNVILYDSEVPIILTENQPIEINNFMSNNKYTFTFISNKSLQFAFSSNIKSQKLLSVEYNNNLIIDKKVDNKDSIINLENKEKSGKLLKIIVENIGEKYENQDFSVIVYEKEVDEFINIKEDSTITINYIKNDFNQNFYFYADISKYIKSSSINFKLDYITKKNNYINIISDIIYSDEILESENFKDLIPKENKLIYSYDIYSDEYLNYYFNDNNQSYKYKYIIIKLEIKDYSIYYNPQYFTISLSKELEIINLINMPTYKAHTITKTTNSYIPLYYKLLLNPESKYIFTAPYQDYILLRKGDLLLNSKINQNYLDDQKDIIILSGLSELTVQIQIFGNELKNIDFYVERINSNDVIIMENERYNNEISINMNEEECNLNKKKYILGTYDKDLYEDGEKKTTKYWMSNDGTMNLYYKNSISLEDGSLFPSSLDRNKKNIETAFVLNNHIDLFTLTCSKPGTFYLKPIMKTFNEKTHIIGQNSISIITLNSKTEILQLTSPIKSPSKYLYLSILPLNGDNITISPDTPGIFDEFITKENKLFTHIIDINKYKSDELAIKITSNDLVNLEIIEVIHYNFSEYIEIDNNNKNEITKNNFVKFIDKDIKKLKINIDGLNNIPISFGIVKLSSDNIDYIPLAYNFGNDIIKKNSSINEVIEIDNKYYDKNDNFRKYQAFIFSIQSSKIDFKYNVKIEEISDKKGISGWAIAIIVIVAIILLILLLCVIIKIKKKKGINIENFKDNQPLYPNKKYILNDMMEYNE